MIQNNSDLTNKLPPSDQLYLLQFGCETRDVFVGLEPASELRLQPRTALSLRSARGSACTRGRGAELRDTVEEPAPSARPPAGQPVTVPSLTLTAIYRNTVWEVWMAGGKVATLRNESP